MSRRIPLLMCMIAGVVTLATFGILFLVQTSYRTSLLKEARALDAQGDDTKAIQYYLKFLSRFSRGQDVKEAEKRLFCNLLPGHKKILGLSALPVVLKTYRSSSSQYVKDMAELTLIHIGMQTSIPGGGNYTDFLEWWKVNVGNDSMPPGMVYVSSGDFIMGDNEFKPPVRKVFLKGFYIDKFEVTSFQFRKFLESTSGASEVHRVPTYDRDMSEGETAEVIRSFLSGKNRSIIDILPHLRPYEPMMYVSHNEAKRYAEWVGKQLPTAEQWEKAARGTDGRLWPWGNEFDYSKCGDGMYMGFTHVGAYPDGISPYGCYDMAGSVWEWISGVFSFNGQPHVMLRGGPCGCTEYAAMCAYRDVVPVQAVVKFGYIPGLRLVKTGIGEAIRVGKEEAIH